MFGTSSPRQWLQSWPRAQELAQQVRWNHFRPEHISTKTWCAAIGNDANNLRHMELQYRIGQELCSVLGVDSSVCEQVLLTELHHDIVEIEAGDIARHHKQVGDEANEIALLEQILAKEDPFCLLTSEQRAVIISTMTDADLAVPSTQAGAIFKISEFIGYARTMLRMYKSNVNIEPRTEEQQALQQHMRYLVQSTFANSGNWISNFIEESSAAHPNCSAYLQKMLNAHRSTLVEIASMCTESTYREPWLQFEEQYLLQNGTCTADAIAYVSQQEALIFANVDRLKLNK